MNVASFLLRHRRRLSWVAIGVALIAVFALGIIGLRKYYAEAAPKEVYSTTTLAFMVLQMLGLDAGAFAEPIGWELELARGLAVLVFLWAILKAAAALFRRPLEAFWLDRCVSRHSVVCGLGDKGCRIARQFLDRGDTVVIIEQDETLSAVEEFRDSGAMVVIGDATHPDVLARTGVRRAVRLVATCGDDATNLRIGTAVASVCKTGAGVSLIVHLHCADAVAFELLASQPAADAGTESPRIEFKRFDIPNNTARLLLASHPLDREPISVNSSRFVQLILLGRSAEAESFLLQCARQAHHANLIPPRIMLIAPDATAWEQSLRFRYPQLDKPCRLDFVQRELCHPETLADLERSIADNDAITTIVLSPPSDREALMVAARLPLVAAARRVRCFTRLGTVRGLSGPANEVGDRVDFVSLDTVEKACDLDHVLQEALDRQAQVMHEAYVREREKEGKSPATLPAIRPWESLAETYRQANRSNADHIPVKLRAVGRVAAAAGGASDPADAFTTDEVEIMARMEHARWNADRWLDGWRYGPKRLNPEKIHDNLVPWEALTAAVQEYDRTSVRKIAAMLAQAGKAIVRQ
jgi:hypothetical protein